MWKVRWVAWPWGRGWPQESVGRLCLALGPCRAEVLGSLALGEWTVGIGEASGEGGS